MQEGGTGEKKTGEVCMSTYIEAMYKGKGKAKGNTESQMGHTERRAAKVTGGPHGWGRDLEVRQEVKITKEREKER